MSYIAEGGKCLAHGRPGPTIVNVCTVGLSLFGLQLGLALAALAARILALNNFARSLLERVGVNMWALNNWLPPLHSNVGADSLVLDAILISSWRHTPERLLWSNR